LAALNLDDLNGMVRKTHRERFSLIVFQPNESRKFITNTAAAAIGLGKISQPHAYVKERD